MSVLCVSCVCMSVNVCFMCDKGVLCVSCVIREYCVFHV